MMEQDEEPNYTMMIEREEDYLMEREKEEE